MADPRRDYYEVLGVPRDADAAKIKSAFRALARRYHPDRNKEPGAEARFKEIAEAYAVLSDPDKRRQYDSAGFAGVEGLSAEDLWGSIDFEDVLGGLGFGPVGFGGGIFDRVFGRRRRGPARGESIELTLEVPLARLVSGGKETVRVPHFETCTDCGGSGAKKGTKPRACETCKGTGQISRSEQRGNVFVHSMTPCQACHGRGHSIDEPCSACKGSGQTRREHALEVHVPPGIEDGMVLRLSGQGLPSSEPGGAPGDALVVVRVLPDSRFHRRGNDLWRAETVEIADAVLGTRLHVPTLERPVEVKVPPGTQPGSMLRVRGKGLPPVGGGRRGDLLVVVEVHVPEHPGKEERNLYERLRGLADNRQAGS